MSNWTRLDIIEERAYHVRAMLGLAERLKEGIPLRHRRHPNIQKIHENGMDGFEMIVHNLLLKRCHTDDGQDYALRDFIDTEHKRWIDLHRNELYRRKDMQHGWVPWNDPHHASFKFFFKKGRMIWKEITVESLSGILLKEMRNTCVKENSHNLRNTYNTSTLLESKNNIGICVTISHTDLTFQMLKDFLKWNIWHGKPEPEVSNFQVYDNMDGERCVIFVLEWNKRCFYENADKRNQKTPQYVLTVEDRLSRLEQAVEQLEEENQP